MTEEARFRDPLASAASAEGALPAPPRAAPVIPGYELLRLIGRGSYGDVWLARDLVGLLRAIKVVWRSRFTEPRPFDREFAGLSAFARLSASCENQVRVLHIGKDDTHGFFYYIMELADDVALGAEIHVTAYRPHTLDRVLAARGRLPPKECLAIAIGLTRAVAELHTRELVHRDIKPANILFVAGVPKLADIGLVSIVSDAETVVGTEGYIPPEGPGAPPADVFGIGKVLYEMLTGEDRRRFPSLPASLLSLPERRDLLELNEIAHRACAHQAERRYPHAQAMLNDLVALQQGKSLRRRSFLRRVVVGTAAAATLPLAYVVYRQRDAWFASGGAGRDEPADGSHAEARRLVAKAETLLSGVFTRSGVETAEELARKATELAPDLAHAWALRAYAAACRLLRGWDSSPQQAYIVQELANRALAAHPAEPTAMLSLAILFFFQGAHARAESVARQALDRDDSDPRLWRILFRAVFEQGRRGDGLALADTAARRFASDALLQYDRALLHGRADDFRTLEQGIDATVAVNPITVAVITKACLRFEQHGDLAGARRALELVRREEQSDERVVAAAMTLGLLERDPVRVFAAASLSAHAYIADFGMRAGPKAMWLALACRQQQRHALEREGWHEAVTVLRERLKGATAGSADRARLAIVLAWLERPQEARHEIRDYEAIALDSPSTERSAMLAVFYAGLGAAEEALAHLRPTLGRWGGLTGHLVRLHPWWDKVRDDPAFAAFRGPSVSGRRAPEPEPALAR